MKFHGNILLLLLVAMDLSINHASATNRFRNETDRLSLIEFKHQISNDPLGVLTSWNHSQNHCRWQGVTCDARHQRVTALTLIGKSLSGTISAHIGNLSFMKVIHLEENQFHGKIPQEIGRLFRLRFLNLTSNTLSGEIPVSLSHCSQMTTISLSSNKLEGKIPTQLSNLNKLEKLHITRNHLTGEIPSSIGNLSSLIQLCLTSNNLEGNLPKEIGMLTSLSLLAVGENKLSGIIPASVFNNSALVSITLAENSFYGNLPPNIGLTLPNMQQLLVGANNFSGNIPISFTNASGLAILDLPENKFEGNVPTNLGDLPYLQDLNLEMNLLGSNSTGDLGFIASLTNNSNLMTFSLANNNFGGEMPRVIANLSYQLTELTMGGNQLLGNIPEGLGSLVNLIHFDVSRNSLSGIMPSDFGKLQNLQVLGLQRNRLSGEIRSTLCNITTLFHLDLADNRLEGKNIFDNILMNCQNLRELDISQNNFNGVISSHFFDKHTSLKLLSLGQNAFSGSIPTGAGKLMHLELFNVSNNKFSGDIPATLGDLSGLEKLLMQGNYFQGIIPQNLTYLKSIQELDLSSNNLTGQIPRHLEKLQFLTYLNLSNNDLEGEIPTAGIFGNSTQISLIGNNKLCGGIPELNFPSCPLIKRKNKAKVKAIIVLSAVLPAMALVLAILAIYFLMYQKRERGKAGSSIMPTTFNKLLRLSYHELHRATSAFSPENLIGSGSFGVVYKGRLDQHGNKLVAVKVLDLQKNGASKSFMAECKALRNIRHRNLISVVSYCSSIDSKGHEFKALVYEFIENGNLDLWLHPEIADQATRSTNLNLSQRLNIAIDVASALHYLHNNCELEIVHCDLKPSNILLNNDLVALVGDFGLARRLPRSVNTSSEQGTSSSFEQGTSSSIVKKGSIGYAAPEYGMGHAASTQGDVYSFGILLLEMITRTRPTDDLFTDGLDLYNYVSMALPEQVFKIVDPMLLTRGNENGEIAPGEQIVNGEKKLECLTSLLKVGLKCSARLPNERMQMSEVMKKLHIIEEAFLGVRTHTQHIDA